MAYKTFTLTFAVLDDKSIKFLKKEEANGEGDISSDAIEVYDGTKKNAEGITKVIDKHFKAEAKGDDTAVVDENEGEVVNTSDEKEGANANPEGQDENAVEEEVVNDAKRVDETVAAAKPVPRDDENAASKEANVGGARRAYPKNVSFSKKYPKNKSNKKTLRNLQRIASH
jgi:hypothetical protein